MDGNSYLDETNVGALLAEALTADVEAVLADQTSRVGADAAASTMLANRPRRNGQAPLPQLATCICCTDTMMGQRSRIKGRRTTRGRPCRRS